MNDVLVYALLGITVILLCVYSLLIYAGIFTWSNYLVFLIVLVVCHAIFWGKRLDNDSNEKTYQEAVHLYDQGASVYLGGVRQQDFEFNGIDSDTYSIEISEDKGDIS